MKRILILFAISISSFTSYSQLSQMWVSPYLDVVFIPAVDENRLVMSDSAYFYFSLSADTIGADSLFLFFGTEQDKGDVFVLKAKIIRKADGNYMRFTGYADVHFYHLNYVGQLLVSRDIINSMNFVTAIFKDKDGLYTEPRYHKKRVSNILNDVDNLNLNILVNSSSDEVQVTYTPVKKNDQDIIEIFNLQGVSVRSATISQNGSEKKAIINTKGLVKGNYILNITVGSSVLKRTISLF